MKIYRKSHWFVLAPLLAAAGIMAVGSVAALLSGVAIGDAAAQSAKEKPRKTAIKSVPKSAVAFPPVSWQLPPDIPGGAGSATIGEAATFAWQEFIALNWPALPQTGVSGSKTRGEPDTTKRFGADGAGSSPASQPVVWETYRSKVETFPGVGNPPGYENGPSQDYGFDVGPQYVYGTRSMSGDLQDNPGGSPIAVPACQNPQQSNVAKPSYVNLDEITQIGVDKMFAGVLPPSISNPTAQNANVQPQLIRFLAKGNRTFYDYAAANKFWYQGQEFNTATSNFQAAVKNDKYPAPTAPIINLPRGTVLVKAAWRPLGPNDNPSDFHTKTVRFYDQNVISGTPAPTPCYREQVWGLIALHIIHKTTSAPYFIFATFEYTSNVLKPNGTPLEDKNGVEGSLGGGFSIPRQGYYDVDGKFYDPIRPKGVPSTPPAGVKLPVIQVLGPYCNTSGNNQLNYQEELFDANGNLLRPLPNSKICVNKRDFEIPNQIVQVNVAAHNALTNYGAPALWQNYKLINVQWQPFDISDIGNFGTSNTSRLPSTFSLANSVVETDNTLQQFFGGLFNAPNLTPTPMGPGSGSVKSAYEGDNGVPGIAQGPAYNIFEPAPSADPPQNSPSFKRSVMGGCMGCHGRAERGGTDFSFTLSGGPVEQPEFAQPAPPSNALAASDFGLGFDKDRLKKLHDALAGH
jgi:hypothetical protein